MTVVAHQTTAGTAFFVVSAFNGKPHFAIEYGMPAKKLVGELHPVMRRVYLSPERANLRIDELIVLYANGDLKDLEAPAEKPEDKAERLAAIVGIIKTSDHEGERANARDAYEKLTGAPYRD